VWVLNLAAISWLSEISLGRVVDLLRNHFGLVQPKDASGSVRDWLIEWQKPLGQTEYAEQQGTAQA
jgi:hypothetical protein